MKSQLAGFICVAIIALLTGCGKGTTAAENWIPDSDPKSRKTESESVVVTQGEELYSAEQLVDILLDENDDTLASLIWEHQQSMGTAQYTEAEIQDSNMLVYYVSSSEGSDSNSGLNADSPKATLDSLSGASNITILLKCGDVFPMESTFQVGSNVMLSSYGKGARPILNFYKEMNVNWMTAENTVNVWKADLGSIKGLSNSQLDWSNCNIGQLLINGECNWKRKVMDSEEGGYVKYLSEVQDGSWAIDWEKSYLYLYSETDPRDMDIQYAYPGHGLSLANSQNVKIRGLAIQGAGFHGIVASGVKNVEISNCYLHHIGGAILASYGSRYGNAIELWDNSQSVTVTGNIAEWIFDTAYTNQGSSGGIIQKDILFEKNISRHSFQGIESWGDSYSEDGFKNIIYRRNILMFACDVTAPETVVYALESGQTVDEEGMLYTEEIPYITYRSGNYPFQQMTLLNISNTKIGNDLTVNQNVFWQSNRLLTLMVLSNAEVGEPDINNNIFYSLVPNEDVKVFRYTDSDNVIHYVDQMPTDDNMDAVLTTEDKIQSKAEENLIKILECILVNTEPELVYNLERTIPSKVLVIGNSLTIGFGTHGMASSDVDTDYYYLVKNFLSELNPEMVMERIAGNGWEGCTSTEQRQQYCESVFDEYLDSSCDLIIVQLGDNVNTNDKLATFPNDCIDLLTFLRNKAPEARIMWVFGRYNLSNASAIKEACEKCRAEFVDISIISTDAQYMSSIGSSYMKEDGTLGTITDAGVASHPGDLGMKVIADAIINQLDYFSE